MGLRTTLVLLAAAVSVTVATSARGESERRPVRLVVRAETSCTDEARFSSALARRSDKLVVDAASADSIAVRVEARSEGTRGELVVTRDGASSTRALEGTTCDEVVRGLSLVAALAFDPDAALDPEPSAAPASAPPVTPPRDRVAAPRESRTGRAARSTIRFGVGGGATFAALGGDDASVGASGFFELQRDRAGFGPQLRVGLARTTAVATTTLEGTGPLSANLALLTSQASMCPVRADLVSGLHLRPCATLELGALTGTPNAPIAGASRTRAWATLGLSIRFDYEIERYFFVELEGGARAPLVRDELGAEPRTVVYRAPALLPSGTLSAGVRFP